MWHSLNFHWRMLGGLQWLGLLLQPLWLNCEIPPCDQQLTVVFSTFVWQVLYRLLTTTCVIICWSEEGVIYKLACACSCFLAFLIWNSLGAEEWLWKKCCFFHGGKEEFLEREQLDRIFRDSNCSFIFDSKPWPSCREAADWNNSCSSAMSCILGLKHVSMHFCPILAMCREVFPTGILHCPSCIFYTEYVVFVSYLCEELCQWCPAHGLEP